MCRTDLHILDGELAAPRLPLVLGHQIVAERMDSGERVGALARVDRRHLRVLRSGRENLCDAARFTGLDRDAGDAELAVPTSASSCRFPTASAISTPRRCCAPGSSATGP